MDPSLCRESLAALLGEEAAALAALEELLRQEHEVLVNNDVAALEKSAPARQEKVGALMRIENERQSLCRMHGYSADRSGLERMIAWCDPEGTLRERLEACAAGAGRCRELNQRNGALVAARMKRVENALNVLTGRPAQAATYDARGGYSAVRGGRTLGQA